MDPTPQTASRNRLTSSATEKSRNSWLKKQTTSPQPLPPTSLFLQRDYLKMVFSQLQGEGWGSLAFSLLPLPQEQTGVRWIGRSGWARYVESTCQPTATGIGGIGLSGRRNVNPERCRFLRKDHCFQQAKSCRSAPGTAHTRLRPFRVRPGTPRFTSIWITMVMCFTVRITK